MGRRTKTAPSYLEKEGLFLSKAAYMLNYFIERADNLINKMPKIDNGSSYKFIKHRIMRDKNCKFKFDNVSVSYV